VFGARALLVGRYANVNARVLQPFFDHLKQRYTSPVFQLRDRNATGRRIDLSRDREADRVYRAAGARLRNRKGDDQLRHFGRGGARRPLRRADSALFDKAAAFIDQRADDLLMIEFDCNGD
jgi:hypothetical protein